MFQTRGPTPSDSALTNFLYRYFTCEALAKILQGTITGKVPSNALGGRVDLRSLTPALARLRIPISQPRLKRIFDSQRVAVRRMSPRGLRDQIVHEMSEAAI